MYSSPTAHSPIPISLLVSLRSGVILKRDFTSDSVPTLPAATLFPCYERSQMPFRYPNFAGGLWMIPKNLFHWKKPLYGYYGWRILFGKVGTFAEDYEFDALILDDSRLRHPQPLNSRERLERLIYLADDSCIAGKYISGNKIFCADNCTIRRGTFMNLDKIFHLKENHTDVKTEVMAGITTFMTMAYILAVNPNILSASGMDRGAVFTATALSSFIATCLMALLSNYPFVLAPEWSNAYSFTYTVSPRYGIHLAAGIVCSIRRRYHFHPSFSHKCT